MDDRLSIVLGFALWRIASAMSMSLRELFGPMVRPALCALASAAVVEILIVQLQDRGHPALQLALEIIVGAVSYVLLLRTAARAQYSQALDLIGRLIRR